MAKPFYKTRLLLILSLFASCFLILLGRLLWLQIARAESLSYLAENQHNIMVQLEPIRGVVYDRNKNPLAVNLNTNSVYASPKDIINKKDTAERLARILDLDSESIAQKIDSDKYFTWIKRKVDYDTAQIIDREGLRGVGMRKETKRFYPNDTLASHVVGFVGMDNVGLEGLEVTFDGYLRGTAGWSWTVRDAKARNILSKQYRYIPPCDGYDLVLSIDEVIQHIVEKELDRTYKKSRAKAASVIVMDPRTGDILALANRPAFDLNNFVNAKPDSRRNRAVTDIFEPGSVFKIVTASAALETGVVDLEKTFFCEEGSYKVRSHTLHDHKPHGDLTFREIIEYSSNIGTVKAAELVGKEKIYSSIKQFGFGRRTGIDLPGEVNGITRHPADWSGISIAAVPIGQEVAVTPIQLISAVSAVANNGILIKPRIVLEIRDKEGGLVKSFESKPVRRVISEPTAILMKEILQGVVDRGTGRRAEISEYTVCGKTGTAQKIESDGRYSHSKFIASFVGFAPADDPRIAVLVSVDEPKGVYYGGSVAAPAFKRIAENVLRYLKVEPDKALLARQ